MKRYGIIIAFIIFIIAFLSIVQVVVSNRLSTSGVSMVKIEEEIHFYKTQNAALSEELFLASSLRTLASKAAELGFIEEKSPLVLTKSDLVLTTSDVVAVRQ